MAATLLFAVLGTNPAHAVPPCWLIQSYEWTYGEPAAEKWAKSNGYTLAQIADVRRRCAARPKISAAR